MPDISSKMQLRAQIIQILQKYRTSIPSGKIISQDIETLKQIKDKKYIAKILFKELASDESPEFINTCAIIALDVLDKESFESYAIDFLQNKEFSDEKKFFIISLIKQKGIYFDYDDIEKYIKNPESIAQGGVKDFLTNAIFDPEAQIDLLDFYINIPKIEKLYLLNNISSEESEDSVICALGLIAQLNLEVDEIAIIKEKMLKTSSPYAISTIEYILKNYKIDLKQRQKFKAKEKKLIEENPDFRNNAIIKDSVLNDCYISFIDGNSNFSLVLSRKMKDSSIDAILLTINTKQGITACMGFGNIPNSNYVTIIRRLFVDSKPLKITPMAFKALYMHYKNKNRKTNTDLPYELIVWESLISDIDDINYDISEFINSKLDTINLTKDKVKKFLSSTLVETWYWTQGQNEAIDNIINTIENEHITDYKKISEIISKLINEKFINNSEFMTEIKDRLILSAYMAHLAKLKFSSTIAYSMCFKNPYFEMFIEYLIDKSIYEYFADIYEENIKQNANSIFKRGQKSCFDIGELDKLMAQIEEKWK